MPKKARPPMPVMGSQAPRIYNMVWLAPGVPFVYNTKQVFSVVGNGVSDDWAALQAAINDTCANKLELILVGNFAISQPLVIPSSSGWSIEGTTGTSITALNETSIFTFPHAGTNGFKISNLYLKWATPASSQAGAGANAFDFTYADGTHGSGVYNFEIENVSGENGDRMFSNGTSNQQSVWGWSIRNCKAYGMAGAYLHFECSDGGLPNCHLDHAYADYAGVTVSDCVIVMTRPDGLLITNCEINVGTYTGANDGVSMMFFGAGGSHGVTVLQSRFEGMLLTASNIPLIYTQVPLTIDGLVASAALDTGINNIAAVKAHFGTGSVRMHDVHVIANPALVFGQTMFAVDTVEDGFLEGSQIVLSGGAQLTANYGPNISLDVPKGNFDSSIFLGPKRFSDLTASANQLAIIIDSTVTTAAATIAGGGTHKVLGLYRGENNLPILSLAPLTSASIGWQGYNLRLVIPVAGLSASPSGIVRVTFNTIASANGQLDAAWIGESAAAGNEYNMDGSQLQLKFGGNTTRALSGAETFVSDFTSSSFTYDVAKKLVVSMHFSGTAVDGASLTQTGFKEYYKLAADESGTSSVTGYTLFSNDIVFVSKIEIQQADSGNWIVVA